MTFCAINDAAYSASVHQDMLQLGFSERGHSQESWQSSLLELPADYLPARAFFFCDSQKDPDLSPQPLTTLCKGFASRAIADRLNHQSAFTSIPNR